MSADVVREAVLELRLDGLVTEGKTPFNKLHFNTCFAEIEALFQRAGYHRQLDVVGYQGLMYALYDPGRWEAVDVLRWLKEFTEAAARTSRRCDPRTAKSGTHPHQHTPQPERRRTAGSGWSECLPFPESRRHGCLPRWK